MKLTEAIAQHFYEVNYGNNWTDACMKDVLSGISYRQATQQVGNANTIALLLFHIDFYNLVVLDRLLGTSRAFQHEESLQTPSIHSTAEWLQLQQKYFENVDRLHAAILDFPDDRLFETTSRNTPYKNLHGVVEHIHYHLGQISLLKKINADV